MGIHIKPDLHAILLKIWIIIKDLELWKQEIFEDLSKVTTELIDTGKLLCLAINTDNQEQ